MKDADKSGSKVLFFVDVFKKSGDYIVNRVKEFIEQRAVFQEKVSEVFINGKNKMPVLAVEHLAVKGERTLQGIFHTTGGAKTALAMKRR